eukprot:1384645-Pyramimonas_sp.AAC.1
MGPLGAALGPSWATLWPTWGHFEAQEAHRKRKSERPTAIDNPKVLVGFQPLGGWSGGSKGT